MQIKIKQLRFTAELLKWSAENPRHLPWKNTKDAYKIWLSEIILQQTRVEQGLPYYEKFVAAYPQITDLAAAPEDEVMRLWQGLGYYSRARNLQITAKNIAEKYAGVFPNTYTEIRALKGIGDYTAAAIASFAFDMPYSVVDGNVYRVLSRVFGLDAPIDSTRGKQIFAELAQELLDKTVPDKYNQAIMDFGATHCTPSLPQCDTCPMQIFCSAYVEGKVELLPIKEKKIKSKNRYFNYFVIRSPDAPEAVFIEKRIGKDIWQDLYQFPMIETEGITEWADLKELPLFQDLFEDVPLELPQPSTIYQQQLSHQRIFGRFWEILAINFRPKDHFILTEKKMLKNMAFPKLIVLYFENKTLPLF